MVPGLVNIPNTMENHHAIHGKVHELNGKRLQFANLKMAIEIVDN